MEQTEMWSVTFIGDYFTMNTKVDATDEESSIEEASIFLLNRYGFIMDGFDAQAELETN